MSDQRPDDEEPTAGGGSIFDLFEPPPEVDPNRFGPIPVVPDPDAPVEPAVGGPTPNEESISEIFGFEPVSSNGGSDHADPVEADTDVDVDATAAIPVTSVDDLAADDESDADEAAEVDVREPDDEEAVVEDAAAETPLIASEPVELPHWTAAATGAVPKVVEGKAGRSSDISGPRWHGEGPQWADDDLERVFADEGGVAEPRRISIDDDELPDLGSAGSPQRTAQAGRPSERPRVEVDTGRNVGQAIGVGIAFAVVAAGAFWLGKATTLGLVIVIAVLAAIELFDAMRRAGTHPATLLGIVAAAALPLAAYHRGHAGFTLVMALTFLSCAMWYLSGADHHRPALNIGLTMLGVAWLGGLASFAAFLLQSAGGIQAILAAVIITVASDTGAYAGGRLLGSTPFHPASPSKTWEGTLIGLIAAVASAFIVWVLEISVFSGTWTDAVILGLVIGIVVPIGDLTESMVKRDLGVKDMGTLLPGHGGFLDRVDGLLFALPATYYLGSVVGLL